MNNKMGKLLIFSMECISESEISAYSWVGSCRGSSPADYASISGYFFPANRKRKDRLTTDRARETASSKR